MNSPQHPSTPVPNQGFQGLHPAGPLIAVPGDATARSKYRRATARGFACRIFPGVYISQNRWNTAPTWEKTRTAIVSAALAYRARFLCGEAAAIHHGLWLPEDPEQLILASANSRRYSEIRSNTGGYRVLLRRRVVPVGEVVLRDGIAVTTIARTVADVAAAVTADEGCATVLMVMESALAKGISKKEIARHCRLQSGSLRGVHTQMCLHHAGERSETAGESLTKAMFLDAGMFDVKQQVKVFDPHGREKARVDFFLPEYNMAVEFDGRGKYLGEHGPSEKVMLREHDRKIDLENQGYVVVQVGWRQVRSGEALRLIKEAMKRHPAGSREISGCWREAELIGWDENGEKVWD